VGIALYVLLVWYGAQAPDARLIVACVVAYLLPGLIALMRGHLNALAIFVANALLGWTTIGWVCVLVWSLTCNVRRA
jgi:hypothetical protein